MKKSLIQNCLNDEKELFIKAQHGDIVSRNILVERNLGLCHKVAMEFHSTFEHDEAVNICAMAMIRAVETFNLDFSAQFSTYACVVMRRKLLEIIRSIQSHERPSSLETMLGEHNKESKLQFENLLDSGERVDECVLKNDYRQYTRLAVNIAKATSSERDFKIFIAYYGLDGKEEKSTTQIARELNINQGTVKHILYTVRGKIKKHFISLGLNAENVLS